MGIIPPKKNIFEMLLFSAKTLSLLNLARLDILRQRSPLLMAATSRGYIITRQGIVLPE